MIRKRSILAIGATALSLAASPATAQTGIEQFNGNWQSSSFTIEVGEWPEMAADGIAIALNGSNRAFEVEWTGLAPDDEALEWDEFDVDFEPASRAGFFQADDVPDVFDGDPQYWAFSGDDKLTIGRLQIDDDTGMHTIYVCTLTRTENGLAAELVLSSTAGPPARAHAELQRR